MRAYPLRGQAGGAWALEIESFFEPCEIASSLQASAIRGPKNSAVQLIEGIFVLVFWQLLISHLPSGG
jgi:hypothetical protein